jgi:hypothetical protein
MAAFLAAPPALLDALQKAFAECDPVLTGTGLAAAVYEKVRDVPGASRALVRNIVRALYNVHGVLREGAEMTPHAAAAEMVDTLRADSYREPAGGWEGFQARAEQLLSDDGGLALSAKALSIAMQTPRHAHAFRVLTDARPIFGRNAKDGPKAFSIIHTLRVQYWQDGNECEWYVSLDSDDLQALQGIAERALAKERSLREALKPLNRPVLCWKGDVDGKQ